MNSHEATAAGDTAVSPPIYACKYCDKRYLSWGVHGAHRRLFEANGELHNCLPPKKEYRSAKRFVFEDDLSGSQYFEGKHVSVLHEALRLPAGMKEQG